MKDKVKIFRSGCGHKPDDEKFDYCPVCRIEALEHELAAYRQDGAEHISDVMEVAAGQAAMGYARKLQAKLKNCRNEALKEAAQIIRDKHSNNRGIVYPMAESVETDVARLAGRSGNTESPEQGSREGRRMNDRPDENDLIALAKWELGIFEKTSRGVTDRLLARIEALEFKLKRVEPLPEKWRQGSDWARGTSTITREACATELEQALNTEKGQ